MEEEEGAGCEGRRGDLRGKGRETAAARGRGGDEPEGKGREDSSSQILLHLSGESELFCRRILLLLPPLS